jgi:hypothetical protein
MEADMTLFLSEPMMTTLLGVGLLALGSVLRVRSARARAKSS